MAKKRVSRSRKRDLNEPDEFISFWSKLFDLISEYKLIFLSALGVMIAVIIVIIGIVYFTKKSASFIYANMCYTAKDYDKAIEVYKKSLINFNDELFIKYLILNGLGYSYKAKKDFKTAAGYFEAIASAPDYTIKDEALFNLGELYAAMGDQDKSTTAFKQIISDHSDSIYIELVKERVTG